MTLKSFQWRVIVSPFKIAAFFAAAFAFSAPAFADPPSGEQHRGWSREQGKNVEEWHKTMCANRYAHSVGRLAELETKLNPTEKQKGLWSQWRQVKVASLAESRDSCLEFTPRPDVHPTILERQALFEKRLTAKLHAIQTERPVLQALYDSLSAEQKSILDRFQAVHGRDHWDGAHKHR